MHYLRFTAMTLAAVLWVASIPAVIAAEQNTDGPAATVQAFNAAVTARDIDAALASLAEGSVQIQLRPVHPGMGDTPPLTGDLRKNWQMVGAILFPASESYDRLVEITSQTESGDVATVWTNTRSRTVRKGTTSASENAFTEAYLLVQKDGNWLIAAIADNRTPDNIGAGTAD
jgi:hypothetical protein